jgi:hypothetical protein
LSSSSIVKQHIQEISEPQCDIFEPEKEKTNNGENKHFHFELQEEVWTDCKSFIYFPFYDLVDNLYGIKMGH